MRVAQTQDLIDFQGHEAKPLFPLSLSFTIWLWMYFNRTDVESLVTCTATSRSEPLVDFAGDDRFLLVSSGHASGDRRTTLTSPDARIGRLTAPQYALIASFFKNPSFGTWADGIASMRDCKPGCSQGSNRTSACLPGHG